MTERTFAGQVAVITGAGAGIGRAVAVDLARRGSRVYLIARRKNALEDVRQLITAHGGAASALPMDITSDDHVASIPETIGRECGRLDILVHSAGVYTRGNVDATPVAELDAAYRTNVRAPFQLTQLLLPLIVGAKGQIVFVNSSVVAGTPAGLSAYGASKHALKAVADALRDEVSPLGVRVASIFPGRTNTPMQQQVHALEGKPFHGDRLMQPEDVAEVIVATLALSRDAEVTNVTVRSARKT